METCTVHHGTRGSSLLVARVLSLCSCSRRVCGSDWQNRSSAKAGRERGSTRRRRLRWRLGSLLGDGHEGTDRFAAAIKVGRVEMRGKRYSRKALHKLVLRYGCGALSNKTPPSGTSPVTNCQIMVVPNLPSKSSWISPVQVTQGNGIRENGGNGLREIAVYIFAM